MQDIDNDSVDCIVTDPPYGMSFMGKDWDKAVPSIAIWRECLRVLKPGAFAFVMCIPRQDCLARMICRLEDAGFNVAFSSIYWTYACLSGDTEVLTKHGWELWHIAKSLYTHILIYNYEEDSYRWEIPAEWHYYKIKDTCYRIKSDFTDQLVTKGHHVAFEHEGKILFLLAEEIGQTVRVPCLDGLRRVQKDISFVTSTNKSCGEAKGESEILQPDMQWKRESTPQDQIQQRTWNRRTKLEREKKRKTTAIDGGQKELGMERRSNIFQKAWQLCKCKICTLSKRIFEYGTQRWLCDGTPLISSARIEKAFMAIRNGASYRSRSNKQQSGQFYAISRQSRAQTARRKKSYKTTLATITKEEYEGIVYCPTVSTGCFVARRRGKIFITGNSGFPKAQNLSKAVDKRAGIKRKVIGQKKLNPKDKKVYTPNSYDGLGGSSTFSKTKNMNMITIPATSKAKALDGAYGGFQPKPAVEIVIVAMRPLEEKTYVDQALKNGHGCTWLDDVRIPINRDNEREYDKEPGSGDILSTKRNLFGMCNNKRNDNFLNKGRFPANVLCEDDVLSNGNITKSIGGTGVRVKTEVFKGTEGREHFHYGDIGSYSRYFSLDAWFAERIKLLPKEAQKTFPFMIIPKASKSEKNRGLENLDYKEGVDIMASAEWQKERGRNPENYKGNKNNHPTCKPLKLMSWLITLASREGDIVLDPFCGSGTTAIAAKMLSRQYIGIEREEEYCEIARKRLLAIPQRLDSYNVL
jgi:DNA modification methylase